MEHRQRHWTDLLLGAIAFAALLTALGYGLILLGVKDRSGRPINATFLPFVAVAGAVFGAFNTWRTGHFLGRHSQPDRAGLRGLTVELTEAASGRPNEAKATRNVATLAVIPAAICGILLGTQLVGETDPTEQLLLVCGGLAFGVGFGVLVTVWAVYRVFGFRPVRVLALTLLGGFTGFFTGVLLGKVFDSWWPWVLGPLGMSVGLAIASVIPWAKPGEEIVGLGVTPQASAFAHDAAPGTLGPPNTTAQGRSAIGTEPVL